MVAEHGHRGIAGIAIEDRELQWKLILAVPGRIVFEFAEIALGHCSPNLKHSYSEKPRAHHAHGASFAARYETYGLGAAAGEAAGLAAASLPALGAVLAAAISFFLQ